MTFLQQKVSNCVRPRRGKASACNIAKSVKRGVRKGPLQKRCSSFRTGLTDLVRRAAVDLGKIYGVKVDQVTLENLSCKQALDRFKEWTESRAVRTAFSRCGRRERVGGRFAFKLLKKQLPQPCACFGSHADAWAERQSKAVNTELPDGFVAHVTREVNRMYPEGWDASYVDAIGRFAPPTSACVEAPVKSGGSRSQCDLDWYLRCVIGEDDDDLFSEHYEQPLSYKEVLSAGKIRPLTVTPRRFNVLRPLHKIIFDRVKRQRWSLIGPPTEEKFRKAGFYGKNPFLSGDYAGATDSLDLSVAGLILRLILSNCRTVPPRVQERATGSLHSLVRMKPGDPFDKWVWLRRGTMMGCLLSFPILCIYNRVCATFTLGDVPMLINGDDLVAETPDPEPWFNTLPSLGLQPERSKTGYSRDVAEVNSTPFVFQKGRLRAVPLVRTRVLAPKAELGTVGSAMETFTSVCHGAMRARCEDIFLARKRDTITKSLSMGLTLADLGFSGERALVALKRNGLLRKAVDWAERLTATNTLPVALPELRAADGTLRHQERRVTVYCDVTSEAYRRQSRMDQLQHTGDLFGTVDLQHEKSIIRVSRWWGDVEASRPLEAKPLPLTHSRSLLLYGGGAPLETPRRLQLYFGELLSCRAFMRRLTLRIVQPWACHASLSETRAANLPSVERWGLSVGPYSEGRGDDT